MDFSGMQTLQSKYVSPSRWLKCAPHETHV
jgi:hypothetical protein